jgi:hypothetical protein
MPAKHTRLHVEELKRLSVHKDICRDSSSNRIPINGHYIELRHLPEGIRLYVDGHATERYWKVYERPFNTQYYRRFIRDDNGKLVRDEDGERIQISHINEPVYYVVSGDGSRSRFLYLYEAERQIGTLNELKNYLGKRSPKYRSQCLSKRYRESDAAALLIRLPRRKREKKTKWRNELKMRWRDEPEWRTELKERNRKNMRYGGG